MKEYILILYTTAYRKGGAKFKRVAHTLAKNLHHPNYEVICQSVESKNEVKSIFTKISDENNRIQELHFIGHSGMYGPMFGTIAYPEQFSPFEIKQLHIPFSEKAEAYFHCCRSSRWFAPYFARTKGVKSYGYYWYTAFSENESYYKIDVSKDPTKELYCFGCPGKKSHGYLTSIKKYFGKQPAEKMKFFDPIQSEVDASYENVAHEYQNVFTDIKVRKDEYAWIKKQLPSDHKIKVLDIGCGNGALLKELAHQIEKGIGIDISENLLQFAIKNNESNPNISFTKITEPKIPFGPNEFDVVISLLSFRYLDWDTIMNEIQRVTKPTGKVLIVDMVTAPLKLTAYPKFLLSKLKHYKERLSNPLFYKNLKKLVTNPAWSTMLKYNPIRSEHEMKWYLESRFPGREIEILNIGYHSRIIAFDSKNMENMNTLELTYP